MAQDWRDQLNSDDPKVRALAVKGIALSGNQANLKYLIDIAENDPDLQLREYAKKAAQHLYSSQSQPEPEPTRQSPAESEPTSQPPSEPEPISQPPTQPEKSESEIAASLAHPMEEIEEEDLSTADIRKAEEKVQRAFSLHTRGQTKKALPIYAEALELNPQLGKNSFSKSVASELTGKPFQESLLILGDPEKLSEFIETNYGKAKKGGKKASSPPAAPKSPQVDRSKTGLIQTWLSFFSMTEDFFEDEVERANTEDTFLSVLVYVIAAVVVFLISGISQFQMVAQLMGDQLSQLGVNLGMIFFLFLIGTVIFTPLTFYINVGIQYLGARVFGGSGDFKSHAYLMALIQVPATILGGVISLVSFVPMINIFAGLAGFGLSIFTIILTVRALKAAHDLSTGRAIAGMIIPPLVFMFLGGCLMMIFGSALAGFIEQFSPETGALFSILPF